MEIKTDEEGKRYLSVKGEFESQKIYLERHPELGYDKVIPKNDFITARQAYDLSTRSYQEVLQTEKRRLKESILDSCKKNLFWMLFYTKNTYVHELAADLKEAGFLAKVSDVEENIVEIKVSWENC